MLTTEEKNNKLKEFLKVLNESLTKEEFLDAFRNVISVVKKTETDLTGKIYQSLAILEAKFSELQGKTDEYTVSKIEGAINDLRGQVEKTMKLEEEMMNMVRDKVKKIKEGKDGDRGPAGLNGKDADESKIKKEISDEMESNLKELKKEIEELKNRTGGRFIFGGGVSKMSMDRFILDPYTPTTVSSTEFTLTKAPNPATSLIVWRGGAKQQLTTDYTVSGKTLNLLVALVSGEILEVSHRI